MVYEPTKMPLLIRQGFDFNDEFTWLAGEECGPLVPINLTGCTALLQVRATPDSPDVLLEMSTANGRILLNEEPGKVRYFVAAADTASLWWDTPAGYDLRITFPGGRSEALTHGEVPTIKGYTE